MRMNQRKTRTSLGVFEQSKGGCWCMIADGMSRGMMYCGKTNCIAAKEAVLRQDKPH